METDGGDEPDRVVHVAMTMIPVEKLLSAVRLRRRRCRGVVVVVVVPRPAKAEAGLRNDDVVANEDQKAGEQSDQDDERGRYVVVGPFVLVGSGEW